jgi:translation initiation factor 1
MSRIVYSTDQGRLCPQCNKAIAQCNCKSVTSPPQGDGIVRISRETKGRKGKGVTIITGLLVDASTLKKLAKELKQKYSCGGAVKDGTIEIQGDQREKIQQTLQSKGYQVKLSGG